MVSLIRLALYVGLPPGRRGRAFLNLFLVVDPIILVNVRRVYQLGNNLEILLQNQHCARILVSSAVVSRAENGNQRASCKAFEAIHHAFVGPHDQTQIVVIQELLHPVRAVFNDVSGSGGVADDVGLDSQISIGVSGVAPEDVHDQLLFLGVHIVDYF